MDDLEERVKELERQIKILFNENAELKEFLQLDVIYLEDIQELIEFDPDDEGPEPPNLTIIYGGKDKTTH